MKKIITGLTYSYNRNIGWQDRTIRTALGIIAALGAIYFYSMNLMLASIFAGLFLAQVFTVFTSKCMICYFTGMCTITRDEKKSLTSRGVPFQN